MGRVIKPPDERRTELLDIGTQLFIDNGIESVSIKDIVNKASVAIGLFYYYFPSKEAFIEEAIDRFMLKYVDDLIAILLREDLSLTERILKALLGFETHLQKITSSWKNSLISSSQHHAFENAMILQIAPILESVIRCGIQEGVFQAIDASIATTFFLHGLSGVLHMKLNAEHFPDYAATIEHIVLSSLRNKE